MLLLSLLCMSFILLQEPARGQSSVGCGGLIDGYRFIVFPSDLTHYKNNEICVWYAQAQQGKQKLTYRIPFMDVKTRANRCSDQLVVLSGRQLYLDAHFVLAIYCNGQVEREVETNFTQLTFMFISDSSFVGYGLDLEVLSRIPSEGDTCGGVYTAESGSLTSPGFSTGRYKSNIECAWNISLTQGKRIHLIFDEFTVEPGVGSICPDSLSVYDGPSPTYPLILFACGYSKPNEVISSGSSMHLVFKTDSSVERRGFSLTYESLGRSSATTSPTTSATIASTTSSTSTSTTSWIPPVSFTQPPIISLTTPVTTPSGSWRPDDCGRRIVFGNHIIGGQEAQPHSWPWMVLLKYNNGRPFCGGSMISDRWVLTAAHCFRIIRDPNMFTISVGEHDITREDYYLAVKTDRTYNVKRVITHEGYDHPNRLNDIALLELTQPVQFNAFVQAVCLPYGNSPSPADNLECTVIGWGATGDISISSNKLRQVNVPIYNQDQCSKVFPIGLIQPQHLCAGGVVGQDACVRDSGGPLMCLSRESQEIVQEGIVSFGAGCAQERPGVYVRVHNFLTWIDTVISGTIVE